jgi:hypothetical protein
MDVEHVKDLNNIRKRLRSNPFKSAVTKKGSDASGQVAPSDSVPEAPVRKNRTLGYDSMVETFAEMIQFLEGEVNYNPKESALTIAGLKETLATLHAHNVSVNEAKEALRSARATRSKVIFAATGIYGIGKKVKKYFKAILGYTSEAYQPIHKIRFANK